MGRANGPASIFDEVHRQIINVPVELPDLKEQVADTILDPDPGWLHLHSCPFLAVVIADRDEAAKSLRAFRYHLVCGLIPLQRFPVFVHQSALDGGCAGRDDVQESALAAAPFAASA